MTETRCACPVHGSWDARSLGHLPACGVASQPDALTRLERMVRHVMTDSPERDRVMPLISEARKEMELLQRKYAQARADIQDMSGARSSALHMGQQQGRAELAQEILAMESWNAAQEYLDDIVSEDAGQ